MDKWFFPMKTVPQQGLGCALACVATVAGVSFDTAKKAAFPRDWRQRVGYGPKTLEMNEDRVRQALRRLGWMTRPVNDFRRLISPSIVFLRYEYGSIHAMVWDPFAKEFRDPGAGYSHRDEILKDWRRGGFRSVTVTGRIPGAGPAPEAPEENVRVQPGVSVDPDTGEDDRDLDDDSFNDGLCGCDSCRATRQRRSRTAEAPAPPPARPRGYYNEYGWAWYPA